MLGHTQRIESYEYCRAFNGYTTPPATTAAVESQRVRERGVALTVHTTEPTLHRTRGSLVQVGFYSDSTSIIEILGETSSTTCSRPDNGLREMAYHDAGESRRCKVAASA